MFCLAADLEEVCDSIGEAPKESEFDEIMLINSDKMSAIL
jgi:hypothetical protein